MSGRQEEVFFAPRMIPFDFEEDRHSVDSKITGALANFGIIFPSVA